MTDTSKVPDYEAIANLLVDKNSVGAAITWLERVYEMGVAKGIEVTARKALAAAKDPTWKAI